MRTFKVAILVVALAMLGSTFTVDAKVKKRRTTKKEKQIQKKKCVNSEQRVLDMVEYSFHGMSMSSISQVRVERRDGKVFCVIKGTKTSERDYFMHDGEEILKKALEIIEQENMLDYDSEYKLPPDNLVSDGFSWSFAAKLADGRSVSSRGRNAEPDGDGLKKIEDLLFERAIKCGLDMVEYSYQGMRINPFAYMRVERKGGKVVMVIKGTTTEKEEYVIRDGEHILYEALKIIEEENMLDYAQSYFLKLEPGERILDGDSWSFSAKLTDGRSVSSRGSNVSPEGNGLNRLSNLLIERAQKLLETKKENSSQ